MNPGYFSPALNLQIDIFLQPVPEHVQCSQWRQTGNGRIVHRRAQTVHDVTRRTRLPCLRRGGVASSRERRRRNMLPDLSVIHTQLFEKSHSLSSWRFQAGQHGKSTYGRKSERRAMWVL